MFNSSSPSYISAAAASSLFDTAGVHHHHPPPNSLFYSSFPSSSFLHRSSSSQFLPLPFPVCCVCSIGDDQCMNGSDPAASSTAGRVGRYSAEERRERIERYRSKRNQRKFHKKITYACRKMLADSRQRVRGRFARNGEAEHETEAEIESTESGGFECWSGDLRGTGGDGGSGGDWWRQMQEVLATAGEEYGGGYDGDLWASFDFESVLA